MPFSYKPLRKLLIGKDMAKKAPMELIGISISTVDKMNRGEYVSMKVIDRICSNFHCDIFEVVAFAEKQYAL